MVSAVPAARTAVSALAPCARSLWCIGKGRSEHCRRLRPKSATLFGVQVQLHGELCVVTLVRVLDLSPDGRSTPGVMLRWFGLFLLARASLHFPRFLFWRHVMRILCHNIGYRTELHSTHPLGKKTQTASPLRYDPHNSFNVLLQHVLFVEESVQELGQCSLDQIGVKWAARLSQLGQEQRIRHHIVFRAQLFERCWHSADVPPFCLDGK